MFRPKFAGSHCSRSCPRLNGWVHVRRSGHPKATRDCTGGGGKTMFGRMCKWMCGAVCKPHRRRGEPVQGRNALVGGSGMNGYASIGHDQQPQRRGSPGARPKLTHLIESSIPPRQARHGGGRGAGKKAHNRSTGTGQGPQSRCKKLSTGGIQPVIPAFISWGIITGQARRRRVGGHAGWQWCTWGGARAAGQCAWNMIGTVMT